MHYYLLLFLLHLSAVSTCGATSRNQRLFLPGAAAGVPAFSPAIQDHFHAAKDLSYYDVHYHPAMMARRGAPPPLPMLGMDASDGVAGSTPPPPEKEAGAAVEPSPLPSPSPLREVDDGGDEQENAMDDVSVDYAGPKTHPPPSPRGASPSATDVWI